MSKNTKNYQSHLEQAQMFHDKKEWKRAKDHWQEAINCAEGKIPNWVLLRKGIADMELGEYNDAEKCFKNYIENEPNQFWGYEKLASLYKRQADTTRELETREIFYNNFPHHYDNGLLLAVFHRKRYDIIKSNRILNKMLLTRSDTMRIEAALAVNARVNREYGKAEAMFFELVQKYPEETDFKRTYILCLLDLSKFDKAQKYFNAYFKNSDKVFERLIQFEIFITQNNRKSAWDEIIRLQELFPNELGVLVAKIRLAIQTYKTEWDKEVLESVLAEIVLFENDRNINRLTGAQIIIHILLGNKNEAFDLIEKLPVQANNTKNQKLWAWKAYKQGNLSRSKRIWEDILQETDWPQTIAPKANTLICIKKGQKKLEDNSKIVFTVIRNEKWRLQWFLDYYRTLGVNQFIIVDNDSIDDSKEFLLAQEDVTLYWTDISYAQSRSGMQWVNHLVQEYGQGNWCLYVDVDEAFVFPNSEKEGLSYLIEYMTKRGDEAMFSFMLDMFSKEFISEVKPDNYMSFHEEYKYFNNEYMFIPTSMPPFCHTVGGIRRILGMCENQTKTPLIRGGRNVKFIMSSHITTPSQLTDVTGVLLHYKFAGNFESKFRAESQINNRIPACNRRHLNYLNQLENNRNHNPFMNATSTEYIDSNQLINLGLITKPILY